MKNKDLLYGFLFGLLAPIAFFYLYTYFILKSDVLPAINRLIERDLIPQITALSVVLGNLFVYFVYNKKNEYQKIKGLVGATLFYALAIAFWNLFK